MNSVRLETDFIGSREIHREAYYGIHTARAKENFSITGTTIPTCLIESLAYVKKACAITNAEVGNLDPDISDAIIRACDEILSGKLHDSFIVDPIQGGAGTSTNMNANEVIANRALEILGHPLGEYSVINPNDHVNLSQSTNDVYPTCIRLALFKITEPLLSELERLYNTFMRKAAEFDDIVKMGRTQLQDAVPIRLGQEFSAYASVITREAGRIRSAVDDLLTVNLGGTAIGTCLNAPSAFVSSVVPVLSALTKIPFRQSSDLIDATQNTDVFVHLSGALKSCGVSLSKICNDLRLMSSGPRDGLGEITLPARQNGSSIMPGKVNPVIPEVVNQIAFRLIGIDTAVTFASEAGQLELNAFEPVIFDSLYQGITQLTHGITTLIDHCISGIVANKDNCRRETDRSIGIVTALCPLIGYTEACHIARDALELHKPIRDMILERGIMTEEEIDTVLDPLSMTGAR